MTARAPLRIAVMATLAALGLPPAVPSSVVAAEDRSDLESFMQQVLSRRDENWKKLQQYTLDEDETFQVSALNGRKLYGFTREYTWYPSETGIFVRSPLSADGVKVSEEDRRKAEDRWIKQEESQDRKRQDPGATDVHADTDDGDRAPGLNDIVKATNEPRFVSSAYFMKFKFDAGSYAFAGREKLLGREVLKIEYYPHHYFEDERQRDDATARKSARDRRIEEKIDRKMDKVAMVTLWIEPAEHQILQYEFTNIDFDFLPGRALVRLDELSASMRMREAFPQVWLPDAIDMAFGMTLALGDVGARYSVKYHDYRLADVKARVR